MSRLTVAQLEEALRNVPGDSEVKVEINDTLETRLVFVPVQHARILGAQNQGYLECDSYEAWRDP